MAEWLRHRGHDVATVAERGPDPGDAAIMEVAVAEQRVLVTADKDFGTLVHLHGASHAGIVRLAHVRTATRLRWMANLLDRHAADEIASAIVTIGPHGIRILRKRPSDPSES